MIFTQKNLKAFLSVVDEGSISRAAKKVNISQPALSRLVGELEARLGINLFERQSQGVVPTAEGAELVHYARHVLSELNDAREALESLQGLKRGVVRIGAVALAARCLLPQVLNNFLTKEPGLRVELVEDSDAHLAPALLRREIDVVIGGYAEPGEGLHRLGVCHFSDSFTVICRAGHPLLEQPDVTLDDVLAERWIMPMHDSSPHHMLGKLLRDLNRPMPTIAIETKTLGTIFSLIAHTDFLAWGPSALFQTETHPTLFRNIPIHELDLKRKLYVYRRDKGIVSEAVKRFLAEIPMTRTEFAGRCS